MNILHRHQNYIERKDVTLERKIKNAHAIHLTHTAIIIITIIIIIKHHDTLITTALVLSTRDWGMAGSKVKLTG